jgi:hypothetical protein
MRTLGKVVAIGVFAVVLTSVVWTSVFIATGSRLTQNMTTLVALASLGIGLYGWNWLAARQPATPSVAETAAKANGEQAVKSTKETKRKNRGRRRKN